MANPKLTESEELELTRLFGYVPEPEPLENMLNAVEAIIAGRMSEVWYEGWRAGSDDQKRWRDPLIKDEDFGVSPNPYDSTRVKHALSGGWRRNAEDCPDCDVTTMAYPFICPGPEENDND